MHTSPSLLDLARQRTSPRLTPRPTSAFSAAIYVVILAAWLFVLYAAFRFDGLLAWAAGLIYVSYDTWLLVTVWRRTRYLLAAPATQGTAAPGAPLTVGVIVAAHNEVRALPRTLDALFAQTDPPERILVVDDGSVDASLADLARRYQITWVGDAALGESASKPGLAVLRRPHGGKAKALNAGLAELHTDVVLTIDADTILEPSAVAGMRRRFASDPGVVAICGVLRPVCEPGFARGFFQWFQTYEYVRAFISRIAWMRSESLLLVSGAFAGFRRDAVFLVGGFDAECLVEDYELIHRMHRFSAEQGRGWRVLVEPLARAVTDVPGTLPSFLRQRRRWFAGFLQTQWWNRDMTGNRRFGRLGTFMMPVKAVDTLQPIYGLTAFFLLLTFIASGRGVYLPVLAVILVKIAIDLCFHLWSVRLYGHWIGEPASHGRLGRAALAALAEPFSFQLMRHTGAAWGWLAFLTGQHSWGSPAVVVGTEKSHLESPP